MSTAIPPPPPPPPPPLLHPQSVVLPDRKIVGQCKWFNDQLGYGFITVVEPFGDLIGKDIFVHHTGLVPKNNSFKTLTKGEYVSFAVEWGHKGELQAFQVTGPFDGSLMCDFQLYPAFPRRVAGVAPGGGGRGRGGGPFSIAAAPPPVFYHQEQQQQQ